MGLLIPIEADPPFETVDELAALVRTGDDHEVKVELSTADPGWCGGSSRTDTARPP